jgi:hypothetical protein
MLQNCHLRNYFLSFLHRPQKMSFLTKTLMDGHRMFICTFKNFVQFFKMYFYNRCICSYEPKHHVECDGNILCYSIFFSLH